MRRASFRHSRSAISQASPNPTTSGAATVPGRIPRSCVPPANNGSKRNPGRSRTYSAPIPLGPYILWAERLSRSTPRSSTSTSMRPTAWVASVWSAAPAARRIAEISASGWMTPISLLASMADTSAVSALSALSSAAMSATPSSMTGRISTSNPPRPRWRTVSRTAGCSVASVNIRPRPRAAAAIPRIARLQDSVAPETNTISPSSAPMRLATWLLAFSTAARASHP